MKSDKIKTAQSIAIVILTILLAVSLFQIHQLSENIEQMNNTISNINVNTRNQIDSIYSNVDEKLREQASLFSFFTYENGHFNSQNNTAELKIILVPKELTEDMEIFTVVDGKKIIFERAGNTFTANLVVDAFRYYDEKPVVNIKTPQTTKTEVLDVYMEYLYLNHLPSIDSHSSTISNFSVKDAPANQQKLTISGSVYANLSNAFYEEVNEDFKNLYVVTQLNGKEVDRYDASAKLKDEVYDISVEYSKTLTVKSGDEVTVLVEGEDSFGYIHKSIAESFIVTDDGCEGDFSSEEMIYDKTGKLLTKFE